MRKANILYICGSLNQTKMMHKISKHLTHHNNYFTPYYGDGYIKKLADMGLLDFSILGGQFKKRTMDYLAFHDLTIDYEGKDRHYDLVFHCSDLIVPKNIRNKKVILVQEGMTDPEGLGYYIVKYLKLPRWMASTSVTGLSNQYDKFCVASEGYKELFIKKGVKPWKIEVTGIPNHDNFKEFLDNDFPYQNYVLAATSDARETFKFENRKKFIKKIVEIATGRKIIFKLHPNENVKRANREISKYAPGALVFSEGKIEEMIANCEVLITKYSTVVYAGLALGKEVHSYFDIKMLRRLLPKQNDGTSAYNISLVAEDLLQSQSAKDPSSVHIENSLKNRIMGRIKTYGRLAKIGS